MNNKSLRVLEWQKVQELVASQASFSLGRARVKALAPSTDLNQVRERLALTTDAVRLLNEHGEAPFGGAGDIKKSGGQSAVGGGF